MRSAGVLQSKDFPDLLRKIPNPPDKLYYRGVWNPDLFQMCLAVVGSRRMTRYGAEMAERLAGEAAAAGITVVSGFMYGIDATAHEATLRVGGKTIAVMPCGADVVHPPHQSDLYRRILENGGLVISEFPFGLQPALWTYPRRNRIVAGLSHATLVIEAAKRSGALITAGFCRAFRRALFAVPGNATSVMSAGTNRLLKEGARVASEPNDILSFFGVAGVSALDTQKQSKSEDGISEKIVKELRREPASADDLSRGLRIASSHLNPALSLLEISGTVAQERGVFYLA